MRNSVVIKCFQEDFDLCQNRYATVAVDVIRATTTAITAVAAGRRCFPVPSVEAARLVQRELANPLMAGEVAGHMPEGFEVNNSPAEIAMRKDFDRPLILLSSSGTKLIHAARESEFGYLACFRNHSSISRYLINHHPKVALIGAGTRGEFREEDQICCAWIASELINAGYQPENNRTSQIVERWGTAPAEACLCSKSADYLRASGQSKDLDFTLEHVNDLQLVLTIRNGEVIKMSNGGKSETHFRLPGLTERVATGL